MYYTILCGLEETLYYKHVHEVQSPSDKLLRKRPFKSLLYFFSKREFLMGDISVS